MYKETENHRVNCHAFCTGMQSIMLRLTKIKNVKNIGSGGQKQTNKNVATKREKVGGRHYRSLKGVLVLAFFVRLFGFLMSSSETKLYRRQVRRLTYDNFTCWHIRDRAAKLDFSLSRSLFTDIEQQQQQESNPQTLLACSTD